MTISELGITLEDEVFGSSIEDGALKRSAIEKAITYLKEHGRVASGEDVRIDGHGKDYVFIRPLPDGFAEVWEYTGKKKKKRVIVPTDRMYRKETYEHFYRLATGEIESPF